MPATCAFPDTREAHLAALQDQGFTCFPGLISDVQLARARAAVDRLMDQDLTRPSDQHYHAPNLVARDPVFLEIARHPLMLGVAEALLGDDCILSSCNLGARRPGGDRQGLHRDTGIWGGSLPYTDFPVGLQTAWCLDDFTLANGATHVIPGTHRRPDARPEEASIQVEAPAGSVIAFDARLFHAGGANRTDRIRRGILTLYIRSWLKPQTDHKRSYPTERIADLDPVSARLLGFQRQTPVEHPDGRSEVLLAAGATAFYGQPPVTGIHGGAS